MNSFGSFFQLKLVFFNACHIDLLSVKQWVLLFYRVADIRGSWCNLSCSLFKITPLIILILMVLIMLFIVSLPILHFFIPL